MAQLSTTRTPDEITIAVDSVTAPFWEAARDGNLVVPHCRRCGHARMPPTAFCPTCRSDQVDWVPVSPRGHIYSYTVMSGVPGRRDLVIVPAVVALQDAPRLRLVMDVVDADPDEVRIGDELSIEFMTIADGWRYPVARRVAG